MLEPAWNGYFADPDVIRTPGGYYAYGTDGPDNRVRQETGRVFPILYSPDLRQWTPVGGALDPPSGLEDAQFWAPGVAEFDGRYFLYYSAGGEEGEGHQLRVALADRPEGPFQDQGVVLMPDEPFSIDAQPFRDPHTGEWWLFFAKDFLAGDFPGTGLAVVRLAEDLLSVVGECVTVLRPSAEWQLFQRGRSWYGREWDAWYTAEGPFCVFRDGRYRLYFSGGLWKGNDYGVAIAEAERVDGPYWELPGRVLQTSSGLRGPGHNSIVVGPDGADYVCFHAWDDGYTRRRMYVVRTDSLPALTL